MVKKEDLKLILIDKSNIDYAIKLENEIFPEYNAKNNYFLSLKKDSKCHYYLIYDNNICVGITGIYAYEKDNINAWLGFFGIKEEFRNKGYGKFALELTEEYAKDMGYKIMRLFTDRLDNDLAINFYKKYGYVFEKYDSDEEFLKDEFDVVIGSKSISDLKVDVWGNRFINLTKQTMKQLYEED